MEAHLASLGRKKLEEIRQKKAAERSQRALPGAGLKNSSLTGSLNIDNEREESSRFLVSQPTEKDYQDLVAYTIQLESGIREQKEKNENLVTKVDKLEAERSAYEKKLQSIEENELPSLRKALKDALMEKDAAITSREDLSSQVRSLKRRLREVEEEQYKTEEHAAALSAELNLLQRQQEQHQSSSIVQFSSNLDEFRMMEQELANVKIQLQEAMWQMLEEQKKLSAEKERCDGLFAENQQLEEKLSILSRKNSEMASEHAGMVNNLVAEKQKHDKEKLHDLAMMVERLEKGRQMLLAEIDAQSMEIEKLFMENADLSASLKDMTNIASQWENQAQECLKQNADLRASLDKLREEHANKLSDASIKIETSESTMKIPSEEGDSLHHATENLKLKGELLKTQTKAEALSAEVMKLSIELKQAHQAYSTVTRLYQPILWNIENRLTQMKQDSFMEVTL
eukprot:TRINITY_DN3895_c0_g1_i1.p1 TRINITY_DN3895_c0_g1~~TRINITY_DN3895_c0_g1_i1.p1  ORF type:complete len:456 (-),score=149.54 TRINITY_DN3895_c0_g1_i1:339-1706(-)